MRFKAKLMTEQVDLLYNLIMPISRLSGSNGNLNSKEASFSGSLNAIGGGGGTIIYLNPDNVRISTRGTGNSSSATPTLLGGTSSSGDTEGILCFADVITTNGLFLEHRIESAHDDTIVFELSLAHLRVALKSILESGKSGGGNHSMDIRDGNGGIDSSAIGSAMMKATSTITMKLAKRNGGLPCLCLDALGGAGGGIDLHHAIPVRIMRAAEMQYHLPPKINMPDVQLELPNNRPLRTVIERLRSMSSQIYLEGSMAGELTIRIEEEGVSIRTFFNKLIPRFEDCKISAEEHDKLDDPVRCLIKVDSKKLLGCLQWQNTLFIGGAVSSAVLCMVENEMLVLHVMLNPSEVGFFTYYIPVHYISEDTEFPE